MAVLIGRKLFYALLSLFLMITLTFILMKTIPGDPFQQEQSLPQEIYETLKSHYGLNQPLLSQYLLYLKKLIMLNLGTSFIYPDRTVSSIIFEGFPISLYLGLQVFFIAVPLGIVIGILAGVKQGGMTDQISTFIAVLGISMPSFIMATFLQYLFAIHFDWLPIARWGSFAQTILPTLSLAILPTSFIARLLKGKMAEEMQKEYVNTARAKGIPDYKIIVFHVLRNAFIPIMSYIGPLFSGIITGSFIIEKIYAIPGLGYWFVSSVLTRDYPLIMGISIFYCCIVLTVSFVIDLLYLYLDPRIRHGIDECSR